MVKTFFAGPIISLHYLYETIFIYIYHDEYDNHTFFSLKKELF